MYLLKTICTWLLLCTYGFCQESIFDSFIKKQFLFSDPHIDGLLPLQSRQQPHGLSFKSEYTDLYRETTVNKLDTLQSLALSIPRTQLSYSFGDSQYNAGIFFIKRGLSFDLRNYTENYSVQTTQSENHAGFYIQRTFPFITGSAFCLSEVSNIYDATTNSPAIALADKISRGISVMVHTPFLQVSLDRVYFLLHSSNTTFSRLSFNAYRNFPLIFGLSYQSLSVNHTFNPFSVAYGISYEDYSGKPDYSLANALPFSLIANAVSRYILLSANKPAFACSLWLQHKLGHGSLKGHEDDYQYITFDTCRLYQTDIRLTATHPNRYRGELFLNYVNIEGGKGFFNPSIFSSWSIFNPVAYKLYNAQIQWNEYGGSLGGPIIHTQHHLLTATGQYSYVFLHAQITSKERRVPPFMPIFVYYLPAVTDTFVDVRYSVPSISLSYSFSYKVFQIGVGISQKVPIEHPSSHDNSSSPELPEKESTNTIHTSGGTTYSMFLNYYR